MTHAEYRHALRLVNTALALVQYRRDRPAKLRRRLRALSLQADLLCATLGQLPAALRRN